MPPLKSNVLILPGYGGSGPDHWQTHWESSHPAFKRVPQKDWDHPDCVEWVAGLEKAVQASGPETVLVAHSLACLQVAFWSARTKLRIRAALLVAPPDPEGPIFPKEARSFAHFPLRSLPFKSILVASGNDPYGTLEFTAMCARGWRSRFTVAGALGHVNAASKLGDWPQGMALLESLL